jgi:hypothetical protein
MPGTIPLPGGGARLYDAEKELWVNAMDYGSDSPYLLWISHACQRVNIFEGSRGQCG